MIQIIESTQFKARAQALEIAKLLAGGDLLYNYPLSKICKYPVYDVRDNTTPEPFEICKGDYWVSDLNDRLEVNTPEKSTNIWYKATE